MPRRRQQIHIGTTVPTAVHARLLEVADELDVSIAEVLRELVNFALRTRGKSDEIRQALRLDVDDEAS